MLLNHPPLLAISRPEASREELEGWARELAAAGVRWLNIRVFERSDRELLATLRSLRRSVGERVRLTVNARPDLCLLAGLEGVHLPAKGLPVAAARRIAGAEALVGRSTHSLAQVRRAASEGADYVLFGPVDPPLSKVGSRPATGLEPLAAACRVGIPVLALGGVTISRLAALGEAGAAGAAGISMFHPAGDVGTLVARAQGAFAATPRVGSQPNQETGGSA